MKFLKFEWKFRHLLVLRKSNVMKRIADLFLRLLLCFILRGPLKSIRLNTRSMISRLKRLLFVSCSNKCGGFFLNINFSISQTNSPNNIYIFTVYSYHKYKSTYLHQ